MTDEPEQLTGGPQDWIAREQISETRMAALARHEAGHGVVWFTCAASLLQQGLPCPPRPSDLPVIRYRLVGPSGTRKLTGGLVAPAFFRSNYAARTHPLPTRRRLLVLELAAHAGGLAAEGMDGDYFALLVRAIEARDCVDPESRGLGDAHNARNAIRQFWLEQEASDFEQAAREGWGLASATLSQPPAAAALDRLTSELMQQPSVGCCRLLELLGDGVAGLNRVHRWLVGP